MRGVVSVILRRRFGEWHLVPSRRCLVADCRGGIETSDASTVMTHRFLLRSCG